MSKIQKVFSDNLKSHRAQKGYTQAQLGELCDSSTNYIAELEATRRFPSPGMIEKLATALGIHPFELFIDPAASKEYVDAAFRHYVANLLKAKITQTVDEFVVDGE